MSRHLGFAIEQQYYDTDMSRALMRKFACARSSSRAGWIGSSWRRNSDKLTTSIPTMVLLTMTPGIVRAVARAEETCPDDFAKLQGANEPTLTEPKPGSPISHSQVIDLSRLLKKHAASISISTDAEDEYTTPLTLNALLAHTTIYTPPPPPKPTQTPEYHALMARLRAQEEALSYERMLHPPPTRETFTQRFPRAPEAFSLGSTPQYNPSEEEEVSYEEVHRQIILIINVLVSIVAVAVFIWVAARHWSVGKRLGLSMGGSGAIAIAEVAVYSGYVRKIKEAKRLEKKKPEIKEIVKSWIIDKDEGGEATGVKEQKVDDGVRFRKGKHR
ncbi:endoplasmic reticulum-based factor for assembly of V-ATPase-domain-containing protein [Pyrenochaeta sp. MPI-SDFR-AT-0127]|nr:endoplasmic reticulum-based factor for assembly of V-ATPase-domain-containing protein [Pyrenochaeta sp. MPI-SDFR-AT-0127]